ncbi:MAG: protein kinase domain-containing protein [Thermoanaerobaculia bacterium]
MNLSPGARLGPYEILALLGAGGMGEVYRARDTRLNRIVAVKVLGPARPSGAEARRRFAREARVIARLSHPSICALYDVGNENEVDYLVMEYIEGETLARRIGRRSLSLEQALRVAAEVADALDDAHRHAVIHRDVKPANIMLTSGGARLLDFGLAKLLAADGVADEQPTDSARETLTEEGRILGTAQYMAPEQLEGQPADARTDIFALGTVLYEMITGQKAFTGKSRSSLIAAILTATPSPIRELEPLAPASLDALVRGCLAKDPEQRWQSARDVALQLRGIETSATGEAARSVRRRRGSRLLLFTAVVAVVAAVGAALFLARRTPRRGDAPAVAFSVSPPATTPWNSRPVQNHFAMSPDGRFLAFAAPDSGGSSVLWVRRIAAFSPVALPGTDGAAAPFWSPDSRYLGFFANGKLKKVEASGGPPLTICDAAGAFFTGSWGSDGEILFAQLLDKAIERVSALGGTAVPIVRARAADGEWSVCWPKYLPDSRHFLYVGRSELASETYVRVGDAATGRSFPLLQKCSRAEFAPGRSAREGDLLFVRDGTLLAQSFDVGRLRLAGEPRPIVSGVLQHAYTGLGGFSASSTGALAFQASTGSSRMLWLGRQGQPLGVVAGAGDYQKLRLSPFGHSVCVSRTDLQTGLRDLWIGDATKGALTRLSAATGDIMQATWSPQEKDLAYASGTLRSAPRLCRVPLDGGVPVVLRPPSGVQTASDWSRDGRFIAYSDTNPETHGDLWIYRVREGNAFAFLRSPDDEIEPQFSPDTRWLAFASNESGAYEIYLAPFPGPGEKIRVSTAGGTMPRWRKDGTELFYVSQDSQMMAVPFRTANGQAGEPKPLFGMDPSGWRDYDVTADGGKFLVIANAGTQSSRFIRVLTNWRLEKP